MTTFDKREEGMEGRFAHDEELRFKATARRDRAFGQYIAELLGKSGDEAKAYADSVIKSNLEAPGDEDMFGKVRGDLDDARVDLSDHLMRKKADELMAEAVNSIDRGK
jgi:hypothetical protein